MVPLESQQENSKGRILSTGQLGWSLLQVVGVVKKKKKGTTLDSRDLRDLKQPGSTCALKLNAYS